MKKIFIFIVGLFFLLSFFNVVKAKNETNDGLNKSSVGVENSNKEKGSGKENASDKSKKDVGGTTNLSGQIAASEQAVAKLNKIKEVTDDPVIEEEVTVLAEEQEAIDKNTETALEEAEDRPAAVKFLIGPDYKNLGQLRSEIVHTRNNIRQLEKIQKRANEEEIPAIEAAILELEESESRLQTEMYDKLSGFSLFGWLFRWLNGFTPPEDEVPPTVTVTPTVTGMLTATPSAILTVTLTPTESITASPTATQTVSPTVGP